MLRVLLCQPLLLKSITHHSLAVIAKRSIWLVPSRVQQLTIPAVPVKARQTNLHAVASSLLAALYKVHVYITKG
jgi:hypothetical protein